MLAADVYTLQAQQIAQHPRVGEGSLQVQFVDPAHQAQDFLADRPMSGVHRAARHVKQFGLLDHVECVVAVAREP